MRSCLLDNDMKCTQVTLLLDLLDTEKPISFTAGGSCHDTDNPVSFTAGGCYRDLRTKIVGTQLTTYSPMNCHCTL